MAERTVAFNPTQFPSDHKVTEWSPGQAIRFQKPIGAPTLGCLPLGLAALAMGPATYLSMRGESTGDALLFGAAVGFFGVILAALPLWIAYTELPRLVLIDWTTRTLAIRRGFEPTGIAFADITALELQRGHGRALAEQLTRDGDVLASLHSLRPRSRHEWPTGEAGRAGARQRVQERRRHPVS